MTTITPSQLAARARASSRVRITAADASEYLEEWREQGVAREVAPGRWALTRAGRAMFAGWALGIQPDGDEGGGA